MQMIKIDGKEYDLDTLSNDVKAKLQSLRFVDTEIGRLEAQVAVFKTARIAYARALNEALQAPGTALSQQFVGDTLKLS